MSEAPARSSGSGIGFFVGFFCIIIILALTVGEDRGKFLGATGTTTVATSIPIGENGDTNPGYYAPEPQTGGAWAEPIATPPLTKAQMEEKVATIYRELDTLRKDLRDARLREPRSPYSGLVSLQAGSVYDTDPDREYLLLRAQSNNTSPLTISGWYLQSYVTDESASIPQGAALMERWRSPLEDDIALLPGESAYLVTGESPIDTSFRENRCTGYLNDEAAFSPSLSEQCPSPRAELARYGKIKLDNDACYALIDRMNTCTTPDDALSAQSEVGSACSTFVEDTFNYSDCVRIHRLDPFFTRDGYWRIYLGERTELWRPQREIIRLMDEKDRVVSVIEY